MKTKVGCLLIALLVLITASLCIYIGVCLPQYLGWIMLLVFSCVMISIIIIQFVGKRAMTSESTELSNINGAIPNGIHARGIIIQITPEKEIVTQ